MGHAVWVLAEERQGELQEVTLELLSEGRRLADRLGGECCAALLGYRVGALAPVLGHYGADKVYLAEAEALETYATLTHTEVLAGAVSTHEPEVLLIGATSQGKDLAPRLAMRLKTGLIADCILLRVDSSQRLLATRPVYADKLYGTLTFANARFQIVTVRPGEMEVARPVPSRRAEVIPLPVSPAVADPLVRVVGFLKADPKTIALGEAPIIVAGGRGVHGREGFQLLEELADALGASIGGTRAVVDAGWIPYERQVGQTGKSVAPNVYVACGISGALQHTMGMKDSRLIIAINSDRNAPIFKVAHVRIVGDLHQVVPAITKNLLSRKRNELDRLCQAST